MLFRPTVARLAMAAALVLGTAGVSLPAQPARIDLSLFREMAWRPVGPFNGGTTTAAVGVPDDPHVFYAGTENGGLFRTTDAGRTWRPVFDDQTTGSIGSIAVSASDHDVVYVGTGAEPTRRRITAGNGLYRSNDGGRTWTNLGLSDSHHLPAVIVDPMNADHVIVAASGSTFSPSDARGVFRSTDGGRSFERVLSGDGHTGGLDLAFDPRDPAIVYATLLDVRPSPPGGPPLHGPGTGLHRSTDGGATWRPSTSGLPTFDADGLRRIRVAVTAANRQRVFALVDAGDRGGLYRSDDAGMAWTLINANADLAGAAADGATVSADPKNADVVYVVGARVLRSADGGQTFAVWRDDTSGGGQGRLWINPSASNVAILAGDRGAVITLNAGGTWSSLANQPTGQFVAVATDNAFPYRICGRERLRLPGCLPSRGPDGGVTPSDWRTVGLAPHGVVLPDPQDPEVVYSGALTRFDRRASQAQDVRPIAAAGERPNTSARLAASADGRTLYYATNLVWRSMGGQTWTPISPPLGVVSSITPSRIDSRLVWVGTESATIHVTRDGGVTWLGAGPVGLTPSSRVSAVEASHFDTNTAYAATDDTASGDVQPRLWRTRDGGATWTDIAAGLPSGAVVHAVREDPFRRGLLFAATARSVFVSFDDGDSWQSLRLNLPPVAATDVTIKDADLVLATDGRGLWVLDDISAFRQITADVARMDVFLFRPAAAWRTPSSRPPADMDPDGARAPNPPDGVALSYLAGVNAGPITIEIIETITNEVIRRFANLSTTPGFHRVNWDLKFTSVDGRGMWVMPGTYQVRLTAGGRVSRQAVIVRMDPRVRTSPTDLAAQFKWSKAVDEHRRRVVALQGRLAPSSPAAAAARDAARELDRVLGVLQQSDTRPTSAAEAAALAAIERADAVLGQGEPDTTDVER